jgi:hypothetical protein
MTGDELWDRSVLVGQAFRPVWAEVVPLPTTAPWAITSALDRAKALPYIVVHNETYCETGLCR